MKKSKKKVQLSKEQLLQIIGKGFFSEWKTLGDVLEKLSKRGYTIKNKQKTGLIAQLLTYLCRDGFIEREKLLGKEQNINKGNWKYKTI